MSATLFTDNTANITDILPDAKLCGADRLFASRAVCDHRQVTPGDIFVALRGTSHQDHLRICEAIDRGALAVVTGSTPREELPIPFCVVKNVHDAFGKLSQHLAGNPSQHLDVVGVAGTSGKPTTSCLVASILSQTEKQVGVLGAIGYFDGAKVEDAVMTTPPTDILADYLARMVKNKCNTAVMEVSSQAIDQSRVAGVNFDRAILTNVMPDHLGYHGSFEEYVATNRKFFDCLSSETLAILSADDPHSSQWITSLNQPVLTVGIDNPADITAQILEMHPSEMTFLLTAGAEAIAVRTEMIGKQHVYNCLQAAAVGLSYEIPLTTIVRGLEAAKHVPGRLERIEGGQPFSVFVDVANTPDAITRKLQVLREVTQGRIFCVVGVDSHRTEKTRPALGRAIQSVADVAVLTSDNPREEDPQKIIRDIAAGFVTPVASSKFSHKEIVCREEAIRWAIAEAKPGDTLLIAGKGHQTYQQIGCTEVAFDDVLVAQDAITELCGE